MKRDLDQNLKYTAIMKPHCDKSVKKYMDKENGEKFMKNNVKIVVKEYLLIM